MRRLRAQERRLEEELRNLGGPSFTAKPPYGKHAAQYHPIICALIQSRWGVSSLSYLCCILDLLLCLDPLFNGDGNLTLHCLLLQLRKSPKVRGLRLQCP